MSLYTPTGYFYALHHRFPISEGTGEQTKVMNQEKSSHSELNTTKRIMLYVHKQVPQTYLYG